MTALIHYTDKRKMGKKPGENSTAMCIRIDAFGSKLKKKKKKRKKHRINFVLRGWFHSDKSRRKKSHNITKCQQTPSS